MTQFRNRITRRLIWVFTVLLVLFIYSCNLKIIIIILIIIIIIIKIIIILNQPGQRLGILCSFKPFTDNGGNSHLLTIKEDNSHHTWGPCR